MLIRKPSDIPSSEITSKESYHQFFSRRRFLRGAAAGAAIVGASRIAGILSPETTAFADTKLQTVKSPLSTTGEQLTALKTSLTTTTTTNSASTKVIQRRTPESCPPAPGP